MNLKTFLKQQTLIQQKENAQKATDEMKSQFKIFWKITEWENIQRYIGQSNFDIFVNEFEKLIEVITDSELQRSLARIAGAIIIESSLLKMMCLHERSRLVNLGYVL